MNDSVDVVNSETSSVSTRSRNSQAYDSNSVTDNKSINDSIVAASVVIPTRHQSLSSQNIFSFEEITFSSNFDNGNLYRVERIGNNSTSSQQEFKIWTANDNMNSSNQSKSNNAWFHFVVTGLSQGQTLRIFVANASHAALYRHDMVSNVIT